MNGLARIRAYAGATHGRRIAALTVAAVSLLVALTVLGIGAMFSSLVLVTWIPVIVAVTARTRVEVVRAVRWGTAVIAFLLAVAVLFPSFDTWFSLAVAALNTTVTWWYRFYLASRRWDGTPPANGWLTMPDGSLLPLEFGAAESCGECGRIHRYIAFAALTPIEVDPNNMPTVEFDPPSAPVNVVTVTIDGRAWLPTREKGIGLPPPRTGA